MIFPAVAVLAADLFRFHFSGYLIRYLAGAIRSRADAPHLDFSRRQQFRRAAADAPCFLYKLYGCAPQTSDNDRHIKFIVKLRRRMIIERCALDDENNAMRLRQNLLVDAGCPQPLGSRPFEKLQVIRVKDDAAGIGIFIVYPDVPAKICMHGKLDGDRKPNIAEAA